MSGLAQAEEALKKAREFSVPKRLSFRFKPDWDQTGRFAREAAQIYRRFPANIAEYLESLSLSATAHENTNVFQIAAADSEEAADALKKLNRLSEAYEKYKLSARLYRLNMQPERAAATYMKGARAAEDAKDLATCKAFLHDACSVYEDENKASVAEQTFKAALNFYLKLGENREALSILSRQNTLYEQKLDMFREDLYKNYLSEVVILLSMNNLEAAQASLSSHEYSHGFPASTAYAAGEAMLTCCTTNAEDWPEIRKRHAVFGFLDVGVARLAQKLALTDVKGHKVSAGQTNAAAEEEEDNGEEEEINLQ